MKRLLSIALCLCVPCWALPSTGYATQGVMAGASLIDFTVIVDLSNMPASWWAEVDTSDGTKGRAAKEDLTELATDWINFDDTGETGILRIIWSGTLSGSIENTVRIYPPVLANSSNAASATYGSNNAYNSGWAGYWPMNDASGDITDRTSNGLNLQATGTPTYDVPGQIGNGIDLDTGDYFSTATAAVTDNPATIMGWFNSDISFFQNIVGVADASTANNYMNLFTREEVGDDPVQVIQFGPSTTNSAITSTTAAFNAWHHAAGRFITDTSVFALLNGGGQIQGTADSGSLTGVDSTGIGRTTDSTPTGDFDGTLNEIQIHSVDRGTDWITEEFDQTNDNATYWGTWSFVEPGGIIPAITTILRRRR